MRDAAADAFRSLSDENLSDSADLIRTYSDSPAFADGPGDLVCRLRQPRALLPDSVIGIPEQDPKRVKPNLSNI